MIPLNFQLKTISKNILQVYKNFTFEINVYSKFHTNYIIVNEMLPNKRGGHLLNFLFFVPNTRNLLGPPFIIFL